MRQPPRTSFLSGTRLSTWNVIVFASASTIVHSFTLANRFKLLELPGMLQISLLAPKTQDTATLWWKVVVYLNSFSNSNHLVFNEFHSQFRQIPKRLYQITIRVLVTNSNETTWHHTSTSLFDFDWRQSNRLCKSQMRSHWNYGNFHFFFLLDFGLIWI